MSKEGFDLAGYTEYEMITKDADGEAHVHHLEARRYLREAAAENIGELLVRQAAPTRITPTRREKPHRSDSVAVFVPDAQIPFDDPIAVEGAHRAVRELMPDEVVLLGDMLDFPGQSRFEHHPNHMGSVQESLDRYHRMMAQFRADAPDAKIYAHVGNHEQRLQKAIIKHNAELLGIRRADAAEELGVLTLEFLLRAEELDVEFVQGYPNGTLWLEDHLKSEHGDISRKGGTEGVAYLDRDPHTSTVHGHSHRSYIMWRTTPTRTGNTQRFSMSPGTVARIDGEVPSYSSTIDEHGQTVSRAENWQQSIGIVEHNERLANPDLAMIQDGQVRIQGDTYDLDVE